jgi:hypothetical protein
VELASRVVSVVATANLWLPMAGHFSQLCRPDSKLLVSSRVYVQLLVKVFIRYRRTNSSHFQEESPL